MYYDDKILNTIKERPKETYITKTEYRNFKIVKNKTDPHYIDTPRYASASSKTKHVPGMNFHKRIGRLDPKTRLKLGFVHYRRCRRLFRCPFFSPEHP